MIWRALGAEVLVAPQLRPADMAAAAASGVTLIVNNRPDGEEPGQPTGAEIEAAARAAGIGYRFLPVAGAIGGDTVSAMAALLDRTPGKILLFCRAGTRSTFLWALAEAERGGDGATILERAEAAGHDLSPIRSYLLR